MKRSLSALKQSIIMILNTLPSGATRTKIVKLLYLADLKSSEEIGDSITGITYKSYYYGPFSDEITTSLIEMNGKQVIERPGIHSNGGTYYKYKLANTGELVDVDYKLDEAEEKSLRKAEILKEIIRTYGELPLKELLNEVYKTANFNNTNFGNNIDLNGSSSRAE